MEKFKYEKYDYAKIGIKKKLFFRQIFNNTECDALGRIFHCNGSELMNVLTNHIKKNYISERNRFSEKNYSIDDFDWEWEIITPERTYKSNETSN